MVLAVVLVILCIFALIGMKKGVIRIAVSLATMVITLTVTTVVSPVLSEYIRNNTTWDDKIEKSIYENVSRDGKSYANDDNELIESGITTYIDNIEEKVGAISERMNLPESLTKSITAATVSELDKTIGYSASLTLKDIASRIFAEQMTRIIVNAVSYCIVFIALFVILKLLTSVTGLISRLPVIHQADRLGGMAAGLIEGLIIVWLAFAVITATGNSSWAADVLAQIHANSFLEFIYNNNLIIRMILSSGFMI